jgi:hypothetical protein
MRPHLTIAVLFVLALPSLALGQVTYVSQSRTIRAFAPGLGPPAPDETRSAPDFAVFDQSVSSTSADTTATATQRSMLQPSEISGTFLASATSRNGFNAIASSLLDVSFTLGAATPYTLTGPYDGIVTVILSGSAGTIARTPPGSIVGNLNSSGVLGAGTYRLQVQCFPDNSGPFAHAGTATISLVVPAPGVLLALLPMGLVRRRRGATAPSSSTPPASA